MPLDPRSYLVSQGWAGEGSALRAGAISRPLAITQKKTLAGLGKDRDEAFPFWDHLFNAAASSIKIHLDSDSDGENEDVTETATRSIHRTVTGIISNRHHITCDSAAPSGHSTPNGDSNYTVRLDLISTAKREAAKRGLYSRFFRGPLLGPEHELETLDAPSPKVAPQRDASTPPPAPEQELSFPEAQSVADVTSKTRKKKRKGNVDDAELSAKASAKAKRKRDQKMGEESVTILQQDDSTWIASARNEVATGGSTTVAVTPKPKTKKRHLDPDDAERSARRANKEKKRRKAEGAAAEFPKTDYKSKKRRDDQGAERR